MSLFGISGARPTAVPGIPGLDDQRRLVARARGLARRWMLRAVLLLVIGAFAVRSGLVLFGLVFLALAILALQLSRSTTRRAAELADKLKLLESP